jgi:cysteinyl-tRNA synthetase
MSNPCLSVASSAKRTRNSTMARTAALSLTDTLSRRKKRFLPRHKNGPVRIFTCGPSVYRKQHLGNYRTFIYEDILVRYLEHLGYSVQRLMNFTDIEDKSLAEAQQHEMGVDALTQPVIEQFRRDARLLRIALPPQIPGASSSVESAVRIIERLIAQGNAYWHNGNVYFDPLTYSGFGQIYGLDMSSWPKKKRRFSRDTYPGERWNLGDFILWHGTRRCRPACWNTRIGRGRPAWNIQDPALILKHLGKTVDISCGGVDNLYRHHDYVRAIMESYSGVTYARFWLHGELLTVNGKKMSKRYGNVIYPDALLQQGYSPAQVRFFLLYGHYRGRLDFTPEHLDQACVRHTELREASGVVRRRARHCGSTGSEGTSGILDEFRQYMNDDLNIRGALDALNARLQSLIVRPATDTHDWRRVSAELDAIDSVLQAGL